MLSRRSYISLLAAAGASTLAVARSTPSHAQGLAVGAAGTGDPSAALLASMAALNGAVEVSVRTYEGTTLLASHSFAGDTLVVGEQQWKLASQTVALPGGLGSDVTVTCTLERGSAQQTAITIDFPFDGWETANYVMIPGIVYNGNRYRALGNGYNPPYPVDMYYNPQSELSTSNNPRLALNATDKSRIELETTATAAPSMSFFSSTLKKGWIVLTEQATRLGNSGLTVEESASRASCDFRISAPVMRQQAPGFGDFRASGDRASTWVAGDAVSIRYQVFTFDADGIPAFLKQFMDLRKSLTGPTNPRNLLPMSKLAELGTGICSGNFITTDVGKYYTPENSRDFQLCWVSGMINTFPMLALDNATERSRVADELDFICSKMQGASGYFFGTITATGVIRSEKAHANFPAVQAMVRKNGDALFWLVKHLMLLKAQGHGAVIKTSWETAAKNLAAAFAQTWEDDGEFGQYIVPATGEIAVYNSTAGAIAPAGLALAGAYFSRTDWLTVAEASAEFYYTRDISSRGFTSGACGDISQDADAETAFGLMESFMALYQYTGKTLWLDRAKVQAALCSSWTLAYNPQFPATSTIAKLGGKMAGAVWASSQNKHAAPGVCTTSADSLFKLYRATGQKKYAELIGDIQHAHSEAVNMPGHITTNYLVGSSMERIQPSDAEGDGAIGNFIYTRNSWTETNGVLMALELPGIYVRPGEDILFAFDHVSVERVSDNATSAVLRLTNRTAYAAQVSVLAETATRAAVPLGYTAFRNWPRVDVPAGGAVTVTVTGDGKVTASSVLNGPSAATSADGKITVQVHGLDNQVYERTFNGTSWGVWTGRGGPNSNAFTGAPAVVAINGRTDTFVRGTDNALWQRTWTTAGGWTAWSSLGGVLTDSPRAAASPDGKITVHVRGTDNQIWERTFNGTSWGGWTGRGGPNSNTFIGAPAVVAINGRTDTFVRGTDNQLWQRTWTTAAGWTGWSALGGVLADSPGAAASSDGKITVTVHGTDNQVYERTFNGTTWNSWTGRGGPNANAFAGAPAVSTRAGRTDIFVRGTDNALWQRTWTTAGGWTAWSSLGGVLA